MSTGRPDSLIIGGTAVDGDGLAGHKVAVGGSKENQSPQKILRIFVALERAAADRRLARSFEMPGILLDHAVAERETRRQVVDADIELAELPRRCPRKGGDRALRRHVMREL